MPEAVRVTGVAKAVERGSVQETNSRDVVLEVVTHWEDIFFSH